jgi:hypothetical protein
LHSKHDGSADNAVFEESVENLAESDELELPIPSYAAVKKIIKCACRKKHII